MWVFEYDLKIHSSGGWGFPGGSDSEESCFQGRRLKFNPGSRRSPGEGYGYPFQYSCLENSMDEELGSLQFTGSQKVRYN